MPGQHIKMALGIKMIVPFVRGVAGTIATIERHGIISDRPHAATQQMAADVLVTKAQRNGFAPQEKFQSNAQSVVDKADFPVIMAHQTAR